MNDKREIVLLELTKEADRVTEDAEHSAKGHFESARAWGKVNKCIGIPATVLAALAGVAAIADHATLSAGIAVVVAILSGLHTFLRPSEQVTLHMKAGNSYNSLRNDARIFGNLTCRSATCTAELESVLSELNSRRNTLNAESPQISRRAYERGKAGIDAGESKYRVDR